MIPGSLNTMMLGGRLPPDFLELVGTPTTTGEQSFNPTFTVPLPSHQIGDLLVATFHTVGFGFGGGGAAPDGWTLMVHQTYPGEGNAARIYYKIAESGAETFVVSTRTDQTTTRTGMGFVFRSKTGRVPQIEAVNSGTGNTYPALTPSAGIQKYSFLLGWFAKRDTSGMGTPTFPSGYSRIALTNIVGSTNSYARAAMGYQNLETDTTTPGAMLDSGGANYTVRIAAVVWEEDK